MAEKCGATTVKSMDDELTFDTFTKLLNEKIEELKKEGNQLECVFVVLDMVDSDYNHHSLTLPMGHPVSLFELLSHIKHSLLNECMVDLIETLKCFVERGEAM